MMNIYLSKFGVYQSEFAFPYVKHERNYAIANLELKEADVMGSMKLQGWCRALATDVMNALSTGTELLNLSISTSDQMILHKFQGKLNREKVIHEMVEAVKCARDGGVKRIGVNAEDASRTDFGYLTEFAIAAKEAGADSFRYCDTLGCETPNEIYKRTRALAEQIAIPIELHCHNDIGLAVANSIAGAQGAIDGGVDAYINTTVNGTGERAGNADLLSCVLALKFGNGMEKYEIGDHINLKMARKLAQYASYAFGIPIPINQTGVGANAFAHEAGIHADGALKDRRNYELFDYKDLGDNDNYSHLQGRQLGRIITTGEFGGIAGLKHVYEQLGITLNDDRYARQILELVQYSNAHTQLPLIDDELRFIAKYPEQVKKILTVTFD
jgi:homocitrate synthase NifV